MKNRLIILAVMFLLLGLAISDVALDISDAAAGKGDALLLEDFVQTFNGGSKSVSLVDEDTPRAVRELNLNLPGETELTKLVIDNEMGDLNIKAVSGGDYKVSGTLTVYALTQELADTYLGQIDVRLRQQAESHFLAVNHSGAQPEEVYVVQMDLEILVPENVNLQAKTSQGLLAAAGLVGNVKLEALFGRIEAWDLTGDLQIRGSYTEIAVRDITGDVRVDSFLEEAYVKDVAGFLEMSSNETDFHVENIQSGVKLDCHYGNGSVDGVGGDLEYTSMLAGIRFSQIAGRISGFSRHGSISIIEPQGDLELKAEYTNLDLRIADDDFKITGTAEFTDINSDFDLALDEEEERRRTFSYLQGEGSNIYHLETRHGNLLLIDKN